MLVIFMGLMFFQLACEETIPEKARRESQEDYFKRVSTLNESADIVSATSIDFNFENMPDDIWREVFHPACCEIYPDKRNNTPVEVSRSIFVKLVKFNVVAKGYNSMYYPSGYVYKHAGYIFDHYAAELMEFPDYITKP